MKKIRLDIKGLSYIGKVHLRHSLKLANAKVEAVADASKRSLKIVADSGTDKLFTDYKNS